MKMKLYNLAEKVLGYIFLIFPIKKNKILFMDFGGKGYGGNPKYISEKVHELYNDFEIVWLFYNMNEEVPDYVKKVKRFSVRAIYEYSTSKVIVQSIRNSHINIKRKKQIYLQTWHGSGLYKKVEASTESALSEKYIKEAKYDGKICDAFLTYSEKFTKIVKDYFWINNKVEFLNFGFPSNDFLVIHKNDEILKRELRKNFNLNESDYLILYAPTFRDDNSTEGYIKNYKKLIKAFEKNTNKKCKILVKFHPNINVGAFDIKYDDELIDVSNYQDIKNLSLISDCMISDYSSSMEDFYILDKPVFTYQKDLKEYLKIRGMFDEFFEYPFVVAYDEDELFEKIINLDMKEYVKMNLLHKQKNMDFNNGDASYKTAKWIGEKITYCK